MVAGHESSPSLELGGLGPRGEKKEMKLNLGCGSSVPDGWVNVDCAIGARLAKLPFFTLANEHLGIFGVKWDRRIYLHDLRRTFPWKDRSADIIYSSHLLEHLSRRDGRRFLAECNRVLRVGGIVRLVVPDLRYSVDQYLEGRIMADEFLQALGVWPEQSEGRLKQRFGPLFRFPHKCMYDSRTLPAILSEMGFQDTAREAFESDIADISSVELRDRTKNAVIVEGRKLRPHGSMWVVSRCRQRP